MAASSSGVVMASGFLAKARERDSEQEQAADQRQPGKIVHGV